MTAVLAAVGVALPFAAAWTALRRLDPIPPEPAALALRAGLSLLLGTGAASLLAYGWLVAGGALGLGYVVVDGALFLALAAGAARGGPERRAAVPLPPAPPLSRAEAAALALAAVALVLVTAAFVSDVSLAPDGDWDAWAMWNQRARFLSRGGDAWRAAFVSDLAWSHLEYPLLLPVSVARLAVYGGEDAAGPVIAALFALAPMLVVFGATARRVGVLGGATAALLLAGSRQWLFCGSAQGADVPVAAFVAAAVAVLLEEEGAGVRRRSLYLALAGALLGLSAWTKDEGIMFATILGGWTLGRGGRAAAMRTLAALGAGAALPVIARVHFQLAVSPDFATALTTGQTVEGVLARMVEGDRWRYILLSVSRLFPSPVLLLVAAVLAVAFGARVRDVPRSFVPPLLGAYVAFLLVYAAAPTPLAWQVKTTARRIFLQPWPALVVALIAMRSRAGDPEASRPPRAATRAPASMPS